MTLNMAIVGYTFKMDLDNNYITYDEDLCGTLVIEKYSSTNVHIDYYQSPNQIWVTNALGFPVPGTYYERETTIVL